MFKSAIIHKERHRHSLGYLKTEFAQYIKSGSDRMDVTNVTLFFGRLHLLVKSSFTVAFEG